MKKKVIVYGVGNYYLENAYRLNQIYDVVFLADSDKEKVGTEICSKLVLGIDEILEKEYDYIFIASCFIKEIKKKLISKGIDKRKIKSIDSEETLLKEKIKFKSKELKSTIKLNTNTSAKKNILIAINSLGNGGAEKVLIDLIKKLDYSKIQLDLLVVFKLGEYFGDVPKEVNIITIFNTAAQIVDGHYIFEKYNSEYLYENFVNNTYDVEIAFLEGQATKLISGSKGNSKKIAWIHTDMVNNHWTSSIFSNDKCEEIQCYQRFNKIICVSKDSKNKFNEFSENKISKKIEIINNLFLRNEIREKANEYDIEEEEVVVTIIGRLVKVKGIDRLIFAHSKLIKEGIKHRLNIIGSGQEEEKLKKLCNEKSVAESVKFLGQIKNPYPYIKAADIIVSSSYIEGFPMVIGEAVILNKVIVATRCSGSVEILGDSEYGLIVDNSESGLYKGIKELIINKGKYAYYSERVKKRSKFLNEEKILDKINRLILN